MIAQKNGQCPACGHADYFCGCPIAAVERVQQLEWQCLVYRQAMHAGAESAFWAGLTYGVIGCVVVAAAILAALAWRV